MVPARFQRDGQRGDLQTPRLDQASPLAPSLRKGHAPKLELEQSGLVPLGMSALGCCKR